jgi:thiol-disulfide isomerase/thioredoxin
LPDLAGDEIDLADYRGRQTLVIFWNPTCGFCRKMLPDLQAWEASTPPGAPALLIVSRGSVGENIEQGIRSKIVLDQGFSTAGTYGASGTPMGILIDAHGNIASELAVGAPAVMALATPSARV